MEKSLKFPIAIMTAFCIVLMISILIYRKTNTYSPPRNTVPTTVQEESESHPIGKLNINTASAEDLLILDGIGPSIAERIITYRKDNGPFEKIEDLMNVKGVGEVTFSKIKDYITTGG